MDHPILSYAKRYAAQLNWKVFPCKGKRPLTLNGVKGATLDETTIRMYFRNDTVNIGVAVPEGYCVLDIDPRNGGDIALEQFLQSNGYTLPETAIQHTGGGGVHYLFKLPDGYKLKRPMMILEDGSERPYSGIDCLNVGKYFIAEPSIHPDTGKLYEWEGDHDPLEGEPIADCPEFLLEPKAQPDSNVVSIHSATGRICFTEDQWLDIGEAMTYFDYNDYDDWIKIGMALHGSDTGKQGLAIWDGWSKQSDKYTRFETTKKWATFDRTRGMDYLWIFSEAANRGWENPLSQSGFDEIEQLKAQRSELDDLESIGEQGNHPIQSRSAKIQQMDAEIHDLLKEKQERAKQPPIEIVPKRKVSYGRLPNEVLNHIEAALISKMDSYCPNIIVGATLSIASLFASRHYCLDGERPINLYCNLVCPDLWVGDNVIAAMENVLSNLKEAECMGETPKSHVLLYKGLLKKPSQLISYRDLPETLFNVKKFSWHKNAEIFELIMKLKNKKLIPLNENWDNTFKKLDHPFIERPALSVVCCSGDFGFKGLFNNKRMDSGEILNFISFHSGDMKKSTYTDICSTQLSAIRDHLNVMQKTNSLLQQKENLGNFKPSLTTIPFEMGCDDLIEQAEMEWLAYGKESGLSKIKLPTIVSSQIENVKRIAGVIAVFDDPYDPVIKQSIVKYAIQLGKENFISTVAYFIADRDSSESDVVDQIIQQAEKCGEDGCSQSHFFKYCRKYRSLTKSARAELLAELIESKELFSIKVETKNRKLVTMYYHPEFVKHENETLN